MKTAVLRMKEFDFEMTKLLIFSSKFIVKEIWGLRGGNIVNNGTSVVQVLQLDLCQQTPAPMQNPIASNGAAHSFRDPLLPNQLQDQGLYLYVQIHHCTLEALVTVIAPTTIFIHTCGYLSVQLQIAFAYDFFSCVNLGLAL